MGKRIRIGIVGVGGVGGYIGAKLAATFDLSPAVEVGVLARGEAAKAIASDGLRLITPAGEITARPSLVTSQPEELGILDLIICCVKTYDLEQAMTIMKPCIGEKTSILPLQNGVDATERLTSMYPGTDIWSGCIYLISRKKSPGLVEQTGDIHTMYFGGKEEAGLKIYHMENVFAEAGIDGRVSEEILRTIWEKYIFISPLGTITSYLDRPIGDILSTPDDRRLLESLLEEVKAVAREAGFGDDIIERTLQKISALPPDSTSSMHRDFKKGGKTEVESLTGYIVESGKKQNIATPQYERIYSELLEKSKSLRTYRGSQ